MVARCPHCGALLDEDFVADQPAEFDCPECDQPVQKAKLLSPQVQTEVLDTGRPAPEEASFRKEFSEPDEGLTSDTPPPGRLECVQKDYQLIILILPGSNRVVRSLGCMAVVWLSIVAVGTSVVVPAGLFRAGLPWEALPFVMIFGILFWGAGLVMLYFWLLARFGKTYVLVEPDRLVIRRVLFGRERLQEYPLDAHSRARLVESYQQNNQPVYKVAIRTASGKSASFGTFLSDEEKRWLVARINHHLRAPGKDKPQRYPQL